MPPDATGGREGTAAHSRDIPDRAFAMPRPVKWGVKLLSRGPSRRRTSALSRAGPAVIRAKAPVSLRRFRRQVRVLAGPYSLGASHHHNPLRLMNISPQRMRRSSTLGLPWLLGKVGFRRLVCASASQQRLLGDQVSLQSLYRARAPNQRVWTLRRRRHRRHPRPADRHAGDRAVADRGRRLRRLTRHGGYRPPLADLCKTATGPRIRLPPAGGGLTGFRRRGDWPWFLFRGLQCRHRSNGGRSFWSIPAQRAFST